MLYCVFVKSFFEACQLDDYLLRVRMSVITNSGALKALCERLSKAEYVTVDTEFLRDKTYY